MAKLILMDGNSIAFRAFYGLPLLTNKSGIHTNAVFGYARLLEKVIKEEDPDYFLVAFDAGKSTFRHKQYKEYSRFLHPKMQQHIRRPDFPKWWRWAQTLQ